jgi:hypothetical protein
VGNNTGWDQADIANPAWQQYTLNQVLQNIAATGSNAWFADSYQFGIGGAGYNSPIPTRYQGTNAANPADWPGGVTWTNQLANWAQVVESGFAQYNAAHGTNYKFLPNLDGLNTTWEPTWWDNASGVPFIDGAFLESFGESTGGDWTLSMNRGLNLADNGKIVIMQPYPSSDPSTAAGQQQVNFYLGTYLLLKGDQTYLNILYGGGAQYWPEYQLNLGTPTTPLPSNVSGYLWNGVYRRDFQNGFVLVNPGSTTYTLNLGGTYQLMQSQGGGTLTDAQLDANGNYIGGSLTYQNVNSITLAGGSAAIFLNPPSNSPNPVVVVAGGAGYSDSGSWHTENNAKEYGGLDRWAYSSGGNGTNTATWQASGLAAGQYTVSVSWYGDPSYASNAPFALYDGSTLLQTVPVNEAQQPTGSTYGGFVFQTLATVTVSSGTLKVVLSNSGTNGSYLVANAVLITPVPVSNTDLNWSASGDGITGPSTVSTQGTFTISRTYTVSGAAAPSSFVIAYYASTSSSTTQDFSKAILLGTETVSAAADLAVGNHSGTSPTFQISSNGSYYLFALLNSTNTFRETNPNNNLAVTASATVVSGPTVVVAGGPGYSDSGSWHTENNAKEYGGLDRWAYSSGGNGANTATWQASGLASGQYTVSVSWYGDPSYASNAPFAIYDGSTLLQTVPVNEAQQPSGTTYGGFVFQTLATVAVSSGTLKVVLSNSGANGSYLVANAVLINPVPSSNTDLNWSASGDGITGPSTASTQTGFTISRTSGLSGLISCAG